MSPKAPIVLGLPALSGWMALSSLSARVQSGLVWWLLGILVLEWALLFWAWRSAEPGKLAPWLLWGLAFRLVGLFTPPILEDDHHRFLWDGRMFALTGNPYASAPSDHFSDPDLPEAFAETLDRINYPDVPTLYGPVTEFAFLLSYLAAPAALWPWKALLLAADFVMILALRRCANSRRGAQAAVFAAWCPLSVFETAFNAHPDALAISLLTLAVVARRLRGSFLLGLACGLAVAAKVFAALLAPFLLWRQRWPAWLVAIGAVIICYAPFWLRGASDLAGLRAFALDWEFNSSIHGLFAWMLGKERASWVSALVFVGIGSWLFARWRSRAPCRRELPPGFLIFGAYFLLTPTFNPWYALWLLPFVALNPTPTGVMMLVAVSLAHLTRQNLGQADVDGFAHPVWVRPVEFGLVAMAWAWDLRQWRSRVARRSS